jgi:hypothetical protein
VAGLVLAAILLRPARPETAPPSVQQLAADLAALTARVTTLEATVTSLRATVTSQATQIGSLQNNVSDLQSKLQFVTVSGTEMYITGANLNIRNGLGATNGNPGAPGSLDPTRIAVNGLGNLIVGYNEDFLGKARNGSHNLVVGPFHAYSSAGGLVVGAENQISGLYASVSGGRTNTASELFASFSGGLNNTASGFHASVSGGAGNTASAFYASVSGGRANAAAGDSASVSGGQANTQNADSGWSGGAFHTP